MDTRQNDRRALKDWENQLIEKYPSIYIEPNPFYRQYYPDFDSVTKTDYWCNLRYGFEFQEGWKDLADDLSNALLSIVGNAKRYNPESYIYAAIFKEKFGQLCWQGDAKLYDEFRQSTYNGLINRFEFRSLSICEKCGRSGSLLSRGGWMKTLCDNHAKEFGYK